MGILSSKPPTWAFSRDSKEDGILEFKTGEESSSFTEVDAQVEKSDKARQVIANCGVSELTTMDIMSTLQLTIREPFNVDKPWAQPAELEKIIRAYLDDSIKEEKAVTGRSFYNFAVAHEVLKDQIKKIDTGE